MQAALNQPGSYACLCKNMFHPVHISEDTISTLSICFIRIPPMPRLPSPVRIFRNTTSRRWCPSSSNPHSSASPQGSEQPVSSFRHCPVISRSEKSNRSNTGGVSAGVPSSLYVTEWTRIRGTVQRDAEISRTYPPRFLVPLISIP